MLFLTDDIYIFFVFLNGFVDKNAAIPNFSLVNQLSLDKILKAEVFVHSDGQLRAAHLILSYTPHIQDFPGTEVRYKAKDPCLHQVSVAVLGFLITDAIPEGTLTTNPIP